MDAAGRDVIEQYTSENVFILLMIRDGIGKYN
jgi:hypothetical protein